MQLGSHFLQEAHPDLPGWLSIPSLPWTTTPFSHTLCASLYLSTDHWHQLCGDLELLDVKGGGICLCILAAH